MVGGVGSVFYPPIVGAPLEMRFRCLKTIQMANSQPWWMVLGHLSLEREPTILECRETVQLVN